MKDNSRCTSLGSTLIPEEDKGALLVPALSSVSFAPRDGTHWFDTSDVARDPYASLFAFLDDPENEAYMVIQVICAPIPDEAIHKFCELLEWKEPGLPPEMFLPHAESHFHHVLSLMSKKHHTLSYEWYKNHICEPISELNYDSDIPSRKNLRGNE